MSANSDCIVSSFQVPFTYRVCFTEDVLASDNPLLADLCMSPDGPDSPARVLFAVDSGVLNAFPELPGRIDSYARTYAKKITQAMPMFSAEGGEAVKKLSVAQSVCGILADAGLCRQSCLILIGGGAFLDSLGLAGSLFHRGLRQIRIPTTALAQCDSGVGVKNAVNAFDRKNLLGTFAPPCAVIDDFLFLANQPPSALADGVAEAVKVAMLKDAAFFDSIAADSHKLASADPVCVRRVVRRCAELHVRHIETNGDPFEFGSARPLDFGHWSAHKLEQLSGYRVRHGQAVGMGLLLDTRYAERKGIAEQGLFDRLKRVLLACGLPFFGDVLARRSADGTYAVLAGIEEFREHLGGRLHITLCPRPGEKLEVTEIDMSCMTHAIDDLLNMPDLNPKKTEAVR